MYNLPNNSKIIISTENSDQTITIPHQEGSVLKYFFKIFIIVWLIGWTFGFIGALTQILQGERDLFLITWFIAWSIGGLFAFYLLYRTFKKVIPEKLTLKKFELLIDTGVPPPSFAFTNIYDIQERRKNFSFKRKIYTFNKNEIQSLKLRETGIKNRLTIDKDSSRIDIAKGATEVEREWLFNHIQKFYLLEKELRNE